MNFRSVVSVILALSLVSCASTTTIRAVDDNNKVVSDVGIYIKDKTGSFKHLGDGEVQVSSKLISSSGGGMPVMGYASSDSGSGFASVTPITMYKPYYEMRKPQCKTMRRILQRSIKKRESLIGLALFGTGMALIMGGFFNDIQIIGGSSIVTWPFYVTGGVSLASGASLVAVGAFGQYKPLHEEHWQCEKL